LSHASQKLSEQNNIFSQTELAMADQTEVWGSNQNAGAEEAFKA